ncbi:MAG: phage tail sheath C-terminal domain-containing protein [Xanthobacteraceae bacterium]
MFCIKAASRRTLIAVLACAAIFVGTDTPGWAQPAGPASASDAGWQYVSVRRLLIFIEQSIDRDLQWAVFEPNAPPLWAAVRGSISNFLTGMWRSGALKGATPEQAFFVRCDKTTMTQTDIDNGRLNIVIGVAPVQPAQFVIISISQLTAGPTNQARKR